MPNGTSHSTSQGIGAELVLASTWARAAPQQMEKYERVASDSSGMHCTSTDESTIYIAPPAALPRHRVAERWSLTRDETPLSLAAQPCHGKRRSLRWEQNSASRFPVSTHGCVRRTNPFGRRAGSIAYATALPATKIGLSSETT